uniref:F-box domain-containing protein n=1 Tax=Fagus sylvatica TaxID=28930 RepID=A0A2N9H1Z7_FAGSY
MSRPTKKPILFSEHVPDDVVYDILTRMPVKSLIRFRCVSKFCNSIITGPDFVTTHFNLSNNNINNHNGYLLYTPKGDKELCTVVWNKNRTFNHISRFEIPFSDDYYIDSFCKGLVCLANYDDNLSHELYLWNPSIRKFKKLRATRFDGRSQNVVLGLAYRCQYNDFKILRIVCHRRYKRQRVTKTEAEVYTLSTDSWREVEVSVESLRGNDIGCNFYLDHTSPCVFFNGVLHSIAKNIGNDDKFILSFDLNDERFREIMLPRDYLDGISGRFECLAAFKESLAFIVFGEGLVDLTGICHIWVMREYGVVESWTKKCIPMGLFYTSFYDCIDTGEFLVQNVNGLVSFDPESLNEDFLEINNKDWVHYTTDSLENLVLLDGVNVPSEHEE